MRYPEHIVEPMRQEAKQIGLQELRTVDQVKSEVENSQGTVLVFVNSVCGCAGGIARPGLALALNHERTPDKLTSVFAGMDMEAVDYARGLFSEYPPSSPQVAIFKDGKVAEVIQRHQIEGTTAEHFAGLLVQAFDRQCGVGNA
jgi:putative YphP/YqiW family bacilliredoxin